MPAKTAGNTRSMGASRGDRAGAGRVPVLVLVAEGNRPQTGGARYPLMGLDQVSIGRGSSRRFERTEHAASLRIPDEWMSSKHANLIRERGRWLIEDPGSKNGVRINGETKKQTALFDGDCIEVGKTVLLFRLGDPGEAPKGATDFGLSSRDPGLASVFDELRRIAKGSSAVLIQGATGTGKERVAHAIHQASARSGSFIAVNCGALADSVMQSELFGYSKGAFSGADADREGLLVASSGGTLFLDEIGDLSNTAQAALLRALEEKEVRPVGSTKTISVDLRVVAASHRDLPGMVQAGQFREDLLARLSGYPVSLPLLRERIDDLGDILAELLGPGESDGTQSVTLDPEVVRAMVRYSWPRNVRELAQALRRATSLAEGGHIELKHLPPELGDVLRASPAVDKPALTPEQAQRRKQLVSLLTKHAGNISAVARDMGKVRAQIQRWVKRYDIDMGQFRT